MRTPMRIALMAPMFLANVSGNDEERKKKLRLRAPPRNEHDIHDGLASGSLRRTMKFDN